MLCKFLRNCLKYVNQFKIEILSLKQKKRKDENIKLKNTLKIITY